MHQSMIDPRNQEKGMKEKSDRKMNPYYGELLRGTLIGTIVYQVELKESNGGAEEEKP